MAVEKRFYSPKEFAEAVGLSSSTVARRLRDGAIPYRKLGSRVLIPASYIDSLSAVSANATEGQV